MPLTDDRIIALLEGSQRIQEHLAIILKQMQEDSARNAQILSDNQRLLAKGIEDNAQALAQRMDAHNRTLAQIMADNTRFMTQVLERIVNTTDRTERMTAEVLARLAKEQHPQ